MASVKPAVVSHDKSCKVRVPLGISAPKVTGPDSRVLHACANPAWWTGNSWTYEYTHGSVDPSLQKVFAQASGGRLGKKQLVSGEDLVRWMEQGTFKEELEQRGYSHNWNDNGGWHEFKLEGGASEASIT